MSFVSDSWVYLLYRHCTYGNVKSAETEGCISSFCFNGNSLSFTRVFSLTVLFSLSSFSPLTDRHWHCRRNSNADTISLNFKLHICTCVRKKKIVTSSLRFIYNCTSVDVSDCSFWQISGKYNQVWNNISLNDYVILHITL